MEGFEQYEHEQRRARSERIRAAQPIADESEQYLRRLKSGGWRLDGYDLDVVKAHADTIAEIYRPMTVGSDLQTLVYEAIEATNRERAKRKQAQQRKVEEQRNRINDIINAAHSLARAHELMTQAEGVEVDPSLMPNESVQPITTEEMQGADTVYLRNLRNSERIAGDREESGMRRVQAEAEALEKLGGAQGKRLAKEIRALAAKHRDKAAAHRANVTAISTELDRRSADGASPSLGLQV